MKKILCLIFLVGMVLTLVSAAESNLGTFQKGEDINLLQLCGNCTYNNISSVIYPNSTVILEEVAMTQQGTEYNYTISGNFTIAMGKYMVHGYGDLDGEKTSWVYNFEINSLGLASTDARSSAANRGVYILFGVSVLFFLGFLFLPNDKTKADEMGNLVYGGNNRPFKWTFFLLSILFLTIGLNTTFISIYNEVGDTQIGAIYDKLGAVSMYLFWFSFGLLVFLWVFTMIASLADKQRMKQAEATGNSTNFDYK